MLLRAGVEFEGTNFPRLARARCPGGSETFERWLAVLADVARLPLTGRAATCASPQRLASSSHCLPRPEDRHSQSPGSGGSAIPRGLARKPPGTPHDESWRCWRGCALEGCKVVDC